MCVAFELSEMQHPNMDSLIAVGMSAAFLCVCTGRSALFGHHTLYTNCI